MAWTIPKTWAVGDPLVAADLNTYVRDNTNFLNSPPQVRAYHATSQSIATGTFVRLAFDSEHFDTDAIHDLSTNNSRLTCKTAGTYLIHVTVEFSGNSTGQRLVAIKANGATTLARQTQAPPGVNSGNITVSTVYPLGVGEYVEVEVFQDSGSTLTIDAAGNFTPEFGMTRVSA